MKWVLRILGIILLILLLGTALMLAFRDALLERALVRSLRQSSGLEVDIGAVRSSVVPLAIQIRGLEIKNPPGFDDGEALRVDEFYVSIERRSLFGGEVRLPEVRLRVPRLVVVQDEQGRTNLAELGRELQRGRSAEPTPSRPKPGETPAPDAWPGPDAPGSPVPPPPQPARERGFRIARLETYVGEVEIHEYRPGEPTPYIQRIPIDREVVFEDVTDLQPVLQQLTLQWAAAALPALLNQAGQDGESGDGLRNLQEMLRRQRRARRENPQ